MTRYAFQDEFDGPAGRPPDPARWRYDLGGGGWGHLAVGGQVGDPPDSTRFPADLMVDYVRVTQPQPG